jgi:hypothetical protein
MGNDQAMSAGFAPTVHQRVLFFLIQKYEQRYQAHVNSESLPLPRVFTITFPTLSRLLHP